MRKNINRSAALLAAVAGVSLVADSASAAVTTAGPLLVNLRASDPTAGSAAWSNKGTLGGSFAAVGAPIVTLNNGTPFVQFDPSEGYRGPTAPADVTGNSDRSIEVWVRNPSLSGEDSMVAWGHRGGPDATNMAFNYGSNESFNAVGHWGGNADMGWGGAPIAGDVHHLVYTYDGAVASVYADGVLKNSKVVALSTHALATDTINLIAQNNAGGGLEFIDSNGIDIAVVRVHGGLLTPAQIVGNFQAGINADVPEPTSAVVCLGAGALFALKRRRRAAARR